MPASASHGRSGLTPDRPAPLADRVAARAQRPPARRAAAAAARPRAARAARSRRAGRPAGRAHLDPARRRRPRRPDRCACSRRWSWPPDADDAVDDCRPRPTGSTTLLDLALVWGDADLRAPDPDRARGGRALPGRAGPPGRAAVRLVPDLQLVPCCAARLPPARSRRPARRSRGSPTRLRRPSCSPPTTPSATSSTGWPPARRSARCRNTRAADRRPTCAGAPADHPRAARRRSTPSASSCRARSGWRCAREPGPARRPAAPPRPRAGRTRTRPSSTGSARPRCSRRCGWSTRSPTRGPRSRRRCCAPAASGVRELRRTARDLGRRRADAPRWSSRSPTPPALVNSTNGVEPVFLPSAEYDVWRDARHRAALDRRWPRPGWR